MQEYVSGPFVKPKITNKVHDTLLDVWKMNNVKITTCVNNSIKHSVGTQLANYETTNNVWNHLRLFTQSNFPK